MDVFHLRQTSGLRHDIALLGPYEPASGVPPQSLCVRFLETCGGAQVEVSLDSAETHIRKAGSAADAELLHFAGTFRLTHTVHYIVADVELGTLRGKATLIPIGFDEVRCG